MNTATSTPQIAPEATGKAAPILEKIQKSMGKVPNIFKTMAHSPHVLEGYMQFSGQLRQGVLSPQDRERIALMLAGFNDCEYCASAHTAFGKKLGLSDEEIKLCLQAESQDAQAQALLSFCNNVVLHKGFVNPEQIETLHQAGYTDEAIIEIVANIAISIFTNYFNHVAGTQNDFRNTH
ncbi:MAG: hypothetical protein B7X06_00555 [Verrucomicrobia bacterium 21-51-4]|nr:MAG: hypothetical protein B7X06_00555 [Verrucomicrobia bacterium 21-51-4]HQU09273.1 carboxymuconolactone decarboxylase family protein [Opitutales bacterium]